MTKWGSPSPLPDPGRVVLAPPGAVVEPIPGLIPLLPPSVVDDTTGPEVTRGGATVGPGSVVDTTGGGSALVLATGGAVELTTAGAVVLEAAAAEVVIGLSFVVPATPFTVALFLSAPITMSNDSVVGIVCVPEMVVVPSVFIVTVAPVIMPERFPEALMIFLMMELILSFTI
jgi:hypothetical protein